MPGGGVGWLTLLAVHSATLLLGRVRWGVGMEYMELGSAKVRLGWGLRKVGVGYKGVGVKGIEC